MNGLAFAISWCIVQVTLVSFLAAAVYLVMGRPAPRVRGPVALTGLLSIVLLSALALSPWPRWQVPEFPRGMASVDSIGELAEPAAAEAPVEAAAPTEDPNAGNSLGNDAEPSVAFHDGNEPEFGATAIDSPAPSDLRNAPPERPDAAQIISPRVTVDAAAPPAAEPFAQPVIQPFAEPVAESFSEPTADSFAEPVAEAASPAAGSMDAPAEPTYAPPEPIAETQSFSTAEPEEPFADVETSIAEASPAQSLAPVDVPRGHVPPGDVTIAGATDDASEPGDAAADAGTPLSALWGVVQHWPVLLLGFIGVSTALGLTRLLIGLAFVRSQRRRSSAIEDAELLEMVDILCDQAGGTRLVDVRESAQLTTAATIGWRKPVILLPRDWTEWTRDERRAVLSHEIAHIRHRDFPAWLAAQLGVSLHFYHPLVHWLAGRLRLEQEIAADRLAASLSGGSALYLNTLASMALRQPKRRLSWSASAFLPSRGTLIRRIEMLKNPRELSSHLSRAAQFLTVALVLAAAVAAAGLRAADDDPPSSSDASLAAEAPKAEARGSVDEFTPDGSPATDSEAFRASSDSSLQDAHDVGVPGPRTEAVKDDNSDQSVPRAEAAAEAFAGPKTAADSDDAFDPRPRAGLATSQAEPSAATAPNDEAEIAISPQEAEHVKKTRENLEKIAAALRKYRAVHGQLPAPSMTRGNSKYPYSWRVAILPFLEGTEALEIYEAYRFFEPWNGPNNMKLLSEKSMPPVFRSPLAEERSTAASYFALTGPLFPNPPAAVPQSLLLGTQQARGADSDNAAQPTWYSGPARPTTPTKDMAGDGPAAANLLIVEARRTTPWTKPSDILFDPDGPIEQLNGYYPQLLPVLDGEGKSRLLPRNIDRDTLIGRLTSLQGGATQRAGASRGTRVESGTWPVPWQRTPAVGSTPAPETATTTQAVPVLSAPVASGAVRTDKGTLRGRVRFLGKPPDRPPLVKAGDASVKDGTVLAQENIPDESLVVGPDGGLANAIVYVPIPPAGSVMPNEAPQQRFELNNGRFEPHVMVVRTGQPVMLANQAPVAGNVHSFPKRNPPFNLVLAPNDTKGVELIYHKTETAPVAVKSDFHPWMSAYHFPLSHAFAAVTKADGTFEIHGLPPGPVKVNCWHESCTSTDRLLMRDAEFPITADRTTFVEFTFKADQFQEANAAEVIAPKVTYPPSGDSAQPSAPSATQGERAAQGDFAPPAPNSPTSGEAAERIAASRRNLKELMLAMHNYHDVHGHFPPARVMGPDGKTPHSWRVAILPYLSSKAGGPFKALYDSYKFDEPWDGPNNRKLRDQMPDVFRAPGDAKDSKAASYFAITGAGTVFDASAQVVSKIVFDDDGARKVVQIAVNHSLGVPISAITDGTSNTLMLIEAKREIEWTKPEDIDFDPAKPLPSLAGIHDEVFCAVTADGAAHAIHRGTPHSILRKLVTRAGGEEVPPLSNLQQRAATVTLPPQQSRLQQSRGSGGLLGFFSPGSAAREDAQQSRSRNNLKSLMLAMHNYHDVRRSDSSTGKTWQSFPPAVMKGRHGRHGKGTVPHSWRVEILPFVPGGKELYERYNFDEPWDGPNNSKLLKEMPAVFRAPGDAEDSTNTSYFAVTGPGTVFDGEEGTSISHIYDGTSNTIMLLESKRAVPWTKPEDIAYDPSQPLPELGGLYPGGCFAGLADGSVRWIPGGVEEAMLRALFTRSGKEVVSIPE